ncbi:MAG: NTP transferase domain-containing protein [Flavobacteriales bacterium]|nr:NTP transferase domain-containing protein [Flavobacteriales bacterium]
MPQNKKQAIIFAAGLGTRLRPITNDLPKVLVEVSGTPMLEWIITKLIDNDFKKIIINTHYFADQIESFIKNKKIDAEIIISYEKDVLETGGGLVFAKDHFDEGDILIYNGDILTDINISDLWDEHINNDAIATFASFERNSNRQFLWDKDNYLCGWRNIESGEYKWSRETDAFSGMPFAAIHVVNTKILNLLPKTGKFSLTPHYIEIAKSNNIKRWISNNNYWFDIGSVEKLNEANRFFEKLKN